MSDGGDTLGQRLRAARGQKGLSAQKAADELHLDGWVIEGLESGDYARIGPAVYAKGHLKRYAELLGLPLPEVLALFDAEPATPHGESPPGMRMEFASPGVRDLPRPLLMGLALVVVSICGVLLWRPWHARTTAVTLPPVVAETGAAGGATAALPPADAGQAVRGPAQTPAAVAAHPVIPAAAAVSPDPRAGAGRARLRLSFLADSWVDVHDATGQRLFAGTGHVNNMRSMSGEAPFRIYLKSASSVRVEINNHVVAVGPQYVIADVAHFEAGADGVLRRDLAAAAAGPRPHG